MKKSPVILFVSILLMSAITAFAQKKKEKSPVDGKIYDVTIFEVKAGKSGKSLPDQISFKTQKVKSKVIEEKIDWTAVKYTITSDSSYTESEGDAMRAIAFEAEATNENDETLKWSGTINNASIDGTIVLSKKGKTKKEFTFSGTEKAKK